MPGLGGDAVMRRCTNIGFFMKSSKMGRLSMEILKYIVISAFTLIMMTVAACGTAGYSEVKQQDDLFGEISEGFSKQEVSDIDISEYPVVGDENAPVTIVEFFDFLCSHCRRISGILYEFAKENPDKVKLVYANYPLDITCNAFVSRGRHIGACLLAKGAICANEQNKFESYRKIAFGEDAPFYRDGMNRLVLDAGLDSAKFDECFRSVLTDTTLQLQIMEAMKLNLPGVPIIYINGKRYDYAVDKNILEKIIEIEISRVKSDAAKQKDRSFIRGFHKQNALLGTGLDMLEFQVSNNMTKPNIISIVGKSNSGKTTLIEKLIIEIKKRGYRIGIIKHSLHGFDMDKSGKDSFRHATAGADMVMAASPFRIGIIKSVESDKLDELIRYFEDVDIIITEGYKKADKPKIEIFRKEVHKKPLCINDDTLFAFVTDSDFNANVPTFKTYEIEKIVDLIETNFLNGS